VFAECVRLDGAIGRGRAEPAVAGGAAAIATVLAAPGDVEQILRARAQTFYGEVGVSAWNGLAVARLCAKDGERLRRDLVAVIAAFGGTPSRLWRQ
jgi:urease accessory protein